MASAGGRLDNNFDHQLLGALVNSLFTAQSFNLDFQLTPHLPDQLAYVGLQS